MNLKDGYKTVEFWLMLVSTAIISFVPDFPQESFLALVGWAGFRTSQKFFGVVDSTGKPSWKTTEFWVTIVYAIANSIFPDMPQEALIAVLGWSGLRTTAKLTAPLKKK